MNLTRYSNHNRFHTSLEAFFQDDPHLSTLSTRPYQYESHWWEALSLDGKGYFQPGIYMLTGGRQVGKSTSCKQLIKHSLLKNQYQPQNMLYLPCDEIYDASDLSQILRLFFESTCGEPFFLIIDEVTFVQNWERTIKALADEGYFKKGFCLLTGSDTLILKEAAMSFPGRRGMADLVDFHLYPLSFREYVDLRAPGAISEKYQTYFHDYLICGGYLPAINDLAEFNEIQPATYLTYEQWIRGDFLKQRKNEETLLNVLLALMTIGVSQVSYTKLAQKIGIIHKDTCIDYCRLLERMDVMISLQAFDQNKQQGSPRKDQKFHFQDPFIYNTIFRWLTKEGYLGLDKREENLVEACVASHCHRLCKTFYFKGQGEIDVIYLKNHEPHAVEIKWASQIRPNDLKMLKHFSHRILLSKNTTGQIDETNLIPVSQYLYELAM